MTPAEFARSLAQDEPPAGLPPALRALWHAARGDWNAAHAVVQAHEGTPACDWVHAHLHRIEGDAANAAYWYRRAARPVATGPLEAERAAILAGLAADG